MRFPVASKFPISSLFVTSQPLQSSKTTVKHPSQVLYFLKTSMFEIFQELDNSPVSWGKPPKTLGGLL